jgi:hypothetical protein
MNADTKSTSIMDSIRSYSGIDIVTIGVLAVLFRVVGMPIYRITMAVFPNNIGLRFGIDVFLAVLAVVLIRKKGVLFAYALAWWLINFAIEGEDLVWLIGMWFPMLAAEMYLGSKKVYGGTMKDVVIGAGFMYGFFFALVYWVYLVTFYELVYALPVILVSLALTVVGCAVGGWLGYLFANKIKPLTV